MSLVNDYIAAVSESHRSELERIRRIVLEAVPEAEEVISYGMPGFKYHGKYLMGFAAFKDHLSIFPTSEPITALRSELGGFALAKGTIQFTPDHPVPAPLIRKLLAVRTDTIDALQ